MVSRRIILEHNWMTETKRELTDEEFWKDLNGLVSGMEGIMNALMRVDRCLKPGEVQIFLGLGLVLIRGQLLKMNMKNVDNVRSRESFEVAVYNAMQYRVCKVVPTGFSFSAGMSLVAGKVGMFMLFFTSSLSVAQASGAFHNYVLVEKWMPGWRTCMGWVVWAQRRARRIRRARRSLPLAMALHARLGEGAGVACLGEDLLRKICDMA